MPADGPHQASEHETAHAKLDGAESGIFIGSRWKSTMMARCLKKSCLTKMEIRPEMDPTPVQVQADSVIILDQSGTEEQVGQY